MATKLFSRIEFWLTRILVRMLRRISNPFPWNEEALLHDYVRLQEIRKLEEKRLNELYEKFNRLY